MQKSNLKKLVKSGVISVKVAIERLTEADKDGFAKRSATMRWLKRKAGIS